MSGRLLSINVARPGFLRLRRRDVPTGIFKQPVEGRVRIERLGVAGDMQADHTFHGGPSKAIYLYSAEHYGYWRPILERDDLSPGFFGENFTAEGVTEDSVRVGDVFRVGTAAVQITKPRSPCFKLGARAGSSGFVRTFLESGRIGYYLRVVEEGEAAAGDSIELLATDPALPLLADVIGSG
ncbi:MAG TPA: MOSC domain-containing protein [Thermoanaerobaculia bacterium]|nr:MOSC domain-containing protein [Thermoanaerobaculia bacterium]